MKRDSDGTTLHHYKDYIMSRDCEIECVLEEGSYIVVPRTTGCAIKQQTATQPETVQLLKPNGQPTEMFESTTSDIFRKFDLVISNTIDFKEFKGLYDIIGRKITEIEFRQNILPKYCTA